ncbi:hypothetical protein DM860_016745 [Cuscuta australis]|uniref:Uncharacterized protein n=1 Tax=Cuscuta australis TaxID=267555 RepID=A0A328DD53_9ASTE|nr:hypothetical protein DM860_016745 [Cuscuta australis]
MPPFLPPYLRYFLPLLLLLFPPFLYVALGLLFRGSDRLSSPFHALSFLQTGRRREKKKVPKEIQATSLNDPRITRSSIHRPDPSVLDPFPRDCSIAIAIKLHLAKKLAGGGSCCGPVIRLSRAIFPASDFEGQFSSGNYRLWKLVCISGS